MNEFTLTFTDAMGFMNALISSVVVILAFSLLAYTLTYNFRHPVARRFAFLLGLVMVTYASEVALTWVISAHSATLWLRFQWLGIALLPWAYYSFSYSILRTTNYHTDRRRLVNIGIVIVALVCALMAFFSTNLVGSVEFDPLFSYLQPGILFWPFAAFFAFVVILSHSNIWKARQRCLTAESRQRMTYLLVASAAPGIGAFPYLIALGKSSVGLMSPEWILSLAIVGNGAVGSMLVILSYSVAFFGVFTPDRVVRYRLIRYFARGPVVAILVILAVQTLPTVEHVLGLPRNIVLFSVITGVIVAAQIVLSITRALTDRLVYGEDHQEIAWLRELDRRLLTTSDLRQFLENHLTMLCEMLRVPSAFVAAAIGTELILEAMVGPEGTRQEILEDRDWSDALNEALVQVRRSGALSRVGSAQDFDGQDNPSVNGGAVLQTAEAMQPTQYGGYWLWPVLEPPREREGELVLGMLGVRARTDAPTISQEELALLRQQLESVGMALMDRKLQMQVMVALRRIIPGIDRIQQMPRNRALCVGEYGGAPSRAFGAKPNPQSGIRELGKGCPQPLLGRPEVNPQPVDAAASGRSGHRRGGRQSGQSTTVGAGTRDSKSAPRRTTGPEHARVATLQHPGNALHSGAQGSGHCQPTGDQRERPVPQTAGRDRPGGEGADGHGAGGLGRSAQFSGRGCWSAERERQLTKERGAHTLFKRRADFEQGRISWLPDGAGGGETIRRPAQLRACRRLCRRFS